MKKIFLMLFALAAVLPAVAQSDDNEDEGFSRYEKSNAIFLGPKVGATFTSMGQLKEVDLYDGAGFGFSAALAGKVRFGKATENTDGGTGMFGLSMELKYKQNKVKTIGSDDLSLGYFEIPITAQVYPFAKKQALNSFFIEAGPDFAFLASKSPDVLSVPSANIAYHTGDFKGGDLRIVAGLGYTIPNTSLEINGRYYIGMSELAGNFPCKMSSIEVSLSWLFKIGQF